MTVTLTPADVLIHFVLILCGAFVLWQLSKLRSLAADLWASRTTVSRRKRIARLESWLSKYESDFSDGRLFIGRMIYGALGAIAALGFGILCLAIVVVLIATDSIQCDFRNTCLTQSVWDSSKEFSAFLQESSFLLLAVVFFVMFSSIAYTLNMGLSPEKLRAHVRDSIVKLSNE